MSDTPHHRLEQLTREHFAIAPYDADWPRAFEQEAAFLRSILPADLVLLISHIGSTAVPGCSGKPIIDVQVEVRQLERVRKEVVPRLEALGYEFIWRPTIGEAAPFYAWFIKRDGRGLRTHHLHMVEPDAASEDRILFRDFLRADSEEVRRYEELKRILLADHANDRAAYTLGKSTYIRSILQRARARRP